MFCLKCGRETTEEQVFCDSCLQTMANYPVKPGTAVNLIARETQKPAVGRKRIPSAEEQLPQMKLAVKRLTLAVVILVVALCLTLISLAHTLLGNSVVPNAPVTGRNYTIDTTQTP